MEQYKLKLKILQLSRIISMSTSENTYKTLTRLSRKGKFITNSLIKGEFSLKCSYKFCKKKLLSRVIRYTSVLATIVKVDNSL